MHCDEESGYDTHRRFSDQTPKKKKGERWDAPPPFTWIDLSADACPGSELPRPRHRAR